MIQIIYSSIAQQSFWKRQIEIEPLLATIIYELPCLVVTLKGLLTNDHNKNFW